MVSPRMTRRPKPQRSPKPGCAPIATPFCFAIAAVRTMMSGSPACQPQAMFAEVTIESMPSSSPIRQGPKPSPMSQLMSTFMTHPLSFRGSRSENPEPTNKLHGMADIRVAMGSGFGPSGRPGMTVAQAGRGVPRSHQHRLRRLHADVEHPLVALDLGPRPDRLRRVVGDLDRRPAVRRKHLADDRDRREAVI